MINLRENLNTLKWTYWQTTKSLFFSALVEDEDEDAELLADFDKEPDSLKARDQSAKHRDTIEGAMSSKFKEILQEVRGLFLFERDMHSSTCSMYLSL